MIVHAPRYVGDRAIQGKGIMSQGMYVMALMPPRRQRSLPCLVCTVEDHGRESLVRSVEEYIVDIRKGAVVSVFCLGVGHPGKSNEISNVVGKLRQSNPQAILVVVGVIQ